MLAILGDQCADIAYHDFKGPHLIEASVFSIINSPLKFQTEVLC